LPDLLFGQRLQDLVRVDEDHDRLQLVLPELDLHHVAGQLPDGR
jgi:hypothetical protein